MHFAKLIRFLIFYPPFLALKVTEMAGSGAMSDLCRELAARDPGYGVVKITKPNFAENAEHPPIGN